MPRTTAWQILRSGSTTPLREVDRLASNAGLDDRDRALVRRLVGVEVRHRGTLRAVTRHFAHRKMKPDLLAHLHLGLAQILYFDRIPERAAVSETCRATFDTVGPSKVNVVNGVLRNVCRALSDGHTGDPRRDVVGRNLSFAEPIFRDGEAHPFLWAEDALSLPANLMKRWTQRHGRELAERMARQAAKEPPLCVRAVGIGAEEARELLDGLGADPWQVSVPGMWRCMGASTEDVVASAAFQEGKLAIQGEAACSAALMMEAREGERLLDLCSAPGGKAVTLASAGAHVVASDLRPRRQFDLARNVARFGFGERIRALVADGTHALRSEASFDGVLVDAPCTNTGVLGARPGARWRFGPKILSELVVLQARLLAEAAWHVRPGGRLVYSVCSLEPEEGERQAQAFLAEHEGWRLDAQQTFLPGVPLDGSDDGPGFGDGGYAARLVRNGA